MSTYNINWQSNNSEGIPGKETIVLPANNINDSSTSLALTGFGISNYGEIQQENFIKLLENFASSTAPAHPTIGQLWFNTGENTLYVRVDPAVVSGGLHPGWMQVFSSSTPQQVVFAGLTEYTPAARLLNRILGMPINAAAMPGLPPLISAPPTPASMVTSRSVSINPSTLNTWVEIDRFSTVSAGAANYRAEISDGPHTYVVEFIVAHNGRGANTVLTYLNRSTAADPAAGSGEFTCRWEDTGTTHQADGTVAAQLSEIVVSYRPRTALPQRAVGMTLTRTISTPPRTLDSGELVWDAQEFAWGWGQTDLVPEYNPDGTLAAAFYGTGQPQDPNIYPATFSNNAWVILLSRLRRALMHVGLSHSLTPPVGFIADGQPVSGGSPLANSYNNYPGHLPNYTSGFGGGGMVALQAYYAQLMSALSQIKERRFSIGPASTEVTSLSSRVRTTPWSGTVIHTMTVTFADQFAARAYFNAGGYLKFNWSHVPSVPDVANVAWQSFLAQETGLIFDYKQLRHADVIEPRDTEFAQSLGFHTIDRGATGTIWQRERNHPGHSMYTGTIEGGMVITAFVSNGANYTITFNISFYENVGTIQGTTTSSLVGFKPASLYMSSPAFSQPVVVSSGTFA